MVNTIYLDSRGRKRVKHPSIYCGPCGCRLTTGEAITHGPCSVCEGIISRDVRLEMIGAGRMRLYRPFADIAPPATKGLPALHSALARPPVASSAAFDRVMMRSPGKRAGFVQRAFARCAAFVRRVMS